MRRLPLGIALFVVLPLLLGANEITLVAVTPNWGGLSKKLKEEGTYKTDAGWTAIGVTGRAKDMISNIVTSWTGT